MDLFPKLQSQSRQLLHNMLHNVFKADNTIGAAGSQKSKKVRNKRKRRKGKKICQAL